MISVVVPVRNDPERLRKCLSSLGQSTHVDYELIVVDDASTDSTADVAKGLGVTLLQLDRRSGPGVARNHGARAAKGEIIMFVDADVCVHRDTLAEFARAFSGSESPDAVFGAYDLTPPEPNLISQYKNLSHHFVHWQGAGEAATFWAGCGAVRREAFWSVGGFDPAYERPSIEDIELGVRLRRAGRRVLLRPEIQGTHLKRWTLVGLFKSDLWDRAVPWTELILRDGRLPDTLNLGAAQRLSALLAYAACGLLLVATAFRPAALLLPLLLVLFVWAGETASDVGSRPARVLMALVSGVALAGVALVGVALGPWMLVLAAPVAASVILNRSFYAFFWRQRGPLFALYVVPLQLAYYVYSGAGFAIGALRHLRRGAPSSAASPPASGAPS